MNLRKAWDKHADEWIKWARTAGHDRAFWYVNLPHFLPLLPKAGRLTLDIGCGEGRMARILAREGHEVVGLDGSPTLAAAARSHEEATSVVAADAARLPVRDEAADLAVAMMSLQDVDELGSAMRETWRVLEPGGRFCLAVVHPLSSAGAFRGERPDSPFVVSGSYSTPHQYTDVVTRDGITMTFHSLHHSLGDYFAALTGAGFVVEELRETIPSEAEAEEHPWLAQWRRMPLFLHVRALKP